MVIPSAQLGILGAQLEIPGRQLEGPHLCRQKCTESQLLRERERDSPSPPAPESQKENRKQVFNRTK